jgi:hypothetical protein
MTFFRNFDDAAMQRSGDVKERMVSCLWAKINGAESWKFNPLVWFVTFHCFKVLPCTSPISTFPSTNGSR